MSGNRNITVRGIVIARRGAGEGSLRVSLYSDTLGLVQATARSAREERSQLRSHLQEGTWGTFTLVLGRDTWRVTGAVDARNLYFSGMEKPAKESAARVLEMVRQLVHGEGSDAGLFASLWEFFHILPLLREKEARDAECLAVLRALSSLGYVEDSPAVRDFLGIHYDTPRLMKARGARSRLVKIINGGIAASGL